MPLGGIGMTIVMLISVPRRAQLIGIRKPIDAPPLGIRGQFLMEATTLTVAGGLLGILCAGIVAWLVRTAMPSIPAPLSWFWAMLGVGISASVGLFFRYWLADRAARLDPIVCLHYE